MPRSPQTKRRKPAHRPKAKSQAPRRHAFGQFRIPRNTRITAWEVMHRDD